jgi:hypothetical protein
LGQGACTVFGKGLPPVDLTKDCDQLGIDLVAQALEFPGSLAELFVAGRGASYGIQQPKKAVFPTLHYPALDIRHDSYNIVNMKEKQSEVMSDIISTLLKALMGLV